jgi:magnesium transporter
MITIQIHGDQAGTLRNEPPIHQLEALAKQPDDLLWIDLRDPTDDEIERIGELFELHHLALDDAGRFGQRPKLVQYDTFIEIVFFALSWPAGTTPQAQEIHFFVGPNYLITLHEGDLPVIPEVAQRWCQHPQSHRIKQPKPNKHRVGLLLYGLLDAIVDDYFPLIDDLADRIDTLEEAVFGSRDMNAQAQIFALKKDLLVVRRVVAPERDVMNVLVRRDTPLFSTREVVYFQDVYDHVLRVTDAIDVYRDLLSSALDASMSITANRLNQVMKTLTASSIILMSMAVVAGVYGMNFQNIPELQWDLGYQWALGLMAAVGGGLFMIFRRIDWL